VTCNGCELLQCAMCVRTYMISSIDDPHCMGCKVAWNRPHMVKSVGTTYLAKKYKEHRTNVLLDRSRAQIPGVLDYAVARKERDTLLCQINDMHREWASEKKAAWSKYQKETAKAYNVHRTRLQVVINERARLLDIMHPGSEEVPKTRSEFMQKCREGDCEGFLSTSWKCRVCDKFTCKDCGVLCGDKSASHEDSEHVCVPDDKASFSMVRSECKPCPKCASSISKIEGCDQMWCTQCNTAFSWRSGKEVNETVHNPHYFEWMRRQRPDGVIPRQPLDVVCGGPVTLNNIRASLSGPEPGYGHPKVKICRNIVQWLTDIEFRIMREIQQDLDNSERKQKDLLSDWVMKAIDEPKFRQILIAKEKKDQQRGEILQVLTTFVNIMKDLLINVVRTVENHTLVNLAEVNEFIVYIYDQMSAIKKVYNLRTGRYIDPTEKEMTEYLGDMGIQRGDH